MVFEEYTDIFRRIPLKEFDKNDMIKYAWRNYWAMIGILTEEDNPDIISEGIYKPANQDILIDVIQDKITPKQYIFIRVKNNADSKTLQDANEIYKGITSKFSVYSLHKILEESEMSYSEEELHALGTGYDPNLEPEIKGIFSKIANSAEATKDQKRATIIAIGYISDPKNFNPILEQFAHDQNPEVVELAQSMLQAGEAVQDR